VLTGIKTGNVYKEKLRRIKYYDKDTERKFVFLTNNKVLPALTIRLFIKADGKLSYFSNG